MPVRTPGSITRASTGRYRLTMSRRLERMRGTAEQTATPVMSASRSIPMPSSSERTTMPCSSAVRSASVDSRQWSTSPTAAPAPPEASES